MKKPKVIVVVGPTASGKTSLGIKIAKHVSGEVISADSRQVYRGLDLGSGKVTQKEMDGIPHHLLDVADPENIYTASEFVRDGREAIKQVHERKKVPIIVGGTFFYVDALLGKLAMPDVEPNPLLRAELAEKSPEELYALLLKKDPDRAQTIDPKNSHRLVRALEIVEAVGKVPPLCQELIYDTYTIGILIDEDTLRSNIRIRLHARLEEGMIEEVAQLHTQGLSYERMEDLGLEYRYIAQYVQGKITKKVMCTEIETKSRQFAKRQMTWLKRDKSIHWVDPKDTVEILEGIAGFLGKNSKQEKEK